MKRVRGIAAQASEPHLARAVRISNGSIAAVWGWKNRILCRECGFVKGSGVLPLWCDGRIFGNLADMCREAWGAGRVLCK